MPVQGVGNSADERAKDGAGEEASNEQDGDLRLIKVVLLVERVHVRALQPVAGCIARRVRRRRLPSGRAGRGQRPARSTAHRQCCAAHTHHEQVDGQIDHLEALERDIRDG